jgi:hypothetical protein
MRRAAKVDANQAEIVAALRRCGATVQHLHTVGQGCPDLLVGRGGVTFLLEVKDGAKPPSRRALTPQEAAWIEGWRGRPVAVVESVDDALAVLGVEIAP